MEIKVGQRYRSQVDTTEVIVVRSSTSGNELQCGGVPMVDFGAQVVTTAPTAGAPLVGAELGKRYSDGTIEILVTKSGQYALSVDDVPLEAKAAKPLPSSD